LDEFDARRTATKITQGGPMDIPDAADRIPTLIENSMAFRKSWARHGSDFRDSRIRSAIAIAPPVQSLFAAIGAANTIAGDDPYRKC
jgi:predicted dienelactone hydrolase